LTVPHQLRIISVARYTITRYRIYIARSFKHIILFVSTWDFGSGLAAPQHVRRITVFRLAITGNRLHIARPLEDIVLVIRHSWCLRRTRPIELVVVRGSIMRLSTAWSRVQSRSRLEGEIFIWYPWYFLGRLAGPLAFRNVHITRTTITRNRFNVSRPVEDIIILR
jgi:hypothetical protein